MDSSYLVVTNIIISLHTVILQAALFRAALFYPLLMKSPLAISSAIISEQEKRVKPVFSLVSLFDTILGKEENNGKT